MYFKNEDERIGYACAYVSMISGIDYDFIKKCYNEKSEKDKKIFLDSFAYEGSIFENIEKQRRAANENKI